ncbi:G2/M phase-specific E3 ubiquitin-protein ligase-like [Melanotaenia boesemani]|uniref:G2/M phase-specific E3 ubiquitin-protein ligase-like n=1 Tax=Melanotaenia boesemani TaxID=1250792 RepID=UPI001C0519D8|nr:G2/M phase-specific E3 ubiquitin-protein ligase-like [Melanotaenia boesemani]
METFEERRRMVIRERCHRMANREEPKDGISLKFKFPDGSVKIGKFSESEPVQVLFDFIGQVEEASEVFKLQEATCSTSIESTSRGVISQQGIRTNSTFYVLWMSSADVEESISNHMDTEQPPITVTSSELLWNPQGPPSSSQIPDLACMPILIEDDESEVPVSPGFQNPETHFLLSPQEEAMNEVNLQTILSKLVRGVDFSMCPTSNQINVCRHNIPQGSLKAFQRQRFNPKAKLDVVFVDEEMNAEGAVDEGGPTREFLRLLLKAIHGCCVFEGHEKDRHLALSTEALETKMYLFVAKMISVCVVHGGVGPHFFSERLYQQICGLPTAPVKVEDVSDHKLREQLMKVQEAETIEEANIAVEEAADSLNIIGSLRRVTKMEEKDSLVRSAVEFLMNGRMRDATDQFVEGFKTLGLLEELQKHPTVFHDLFVCEEKPLTAKDLSSLFTVAFSVQGSNRRVQENQSICFWRDWLIDIEEEEAGPITLETVLEFTSGASAVPPLGFPYQPQIQFLHDHTKIYPEANTCVVVLYLPIHSSYEAFKKYMMEGILQAPTFGVA